MRVPPGSTSMRPAAHARHERGLVHEVCETAAEPLRGADLVIFCVPARRDGRRRSASARRAARRCPDQRRRLVQAADRQGDWARRCPIMSSSPPIRSPAPRIPARTRALPSCSKAAGASSPRPNHTDLVKLNALVAFWEALGANVETDEPAHHDLVLAVTSHLPHLIAYTIVGTASDLEDVTQSEVIKYSAGGFRDFTRIAASDPTMWRDVFLSNKDAVLTMLQRFTEDLTALAARDPRGRRRHPVRSFHPHPRDPPLDHRGRPGRFARRFRPRRPCKGARSRQRQLNAAQELAQVLPVAVLKTAKKYAKFDPAREPPGLSRLAPANPHPRCQSDAALDRSRA